MNKYLIEVGVEELPSHYIEPALSDFENALAGALEVERVAYENIKAYASPRRLTLIIEGLADRQEDVHDKVRGPAKRIAYLEDGSINKPLEGFMRSQGVEEKDIVLEEYKGEDYAFALIHREGQETKDLLKTLVPQAIRAIHFPKMMRWGGKNLRFARPIRWLVSLYNDEVLAFDLEGIPLDRYTRGHRFLGSDHIEIKRVEDYEGLLEENYVLVDQDKRRESIQYQTQRMARTLGGETHPDPDLLEELTYIVEYPTAILGRVKKDHLSLPDIVITTSMREHLRYVPVYDVEGQLMPYFITIRNGTDDYKEVVSQGNEKVLGARLEDAIFFYEEDSKKPLEDFVPALEGIIFQEELGTMADKVKRTQALVAKLGNRLGVGKTTIAASQRAAYLAKADLTSNLVQEFTELEGTMGRIYALNSGEDDIVGQAIEEHYMPKGAKGDLPKSTTGSILSIADKLDTICGLFAIEKLPTGSQDPFGLRRLVIGILRILRNKNWNIGIDGMVESSLFTYVDQQGLTFDHEEVRGKVLDFMLGRASNMLLDEGVPYDVVDAVVASTEDLSASIFTKARDLEDFLKEDGAKAFVEAAERLGNMAKHREETMTFKEDLLEESEEGLYKAYRAIKPQWEDAFSRGKYREALDILASLTGPIHDYFEANMVLVEDPALRANRLALLGAIDEKIKKIFDSANIVM
ncbi:MAG: glycine--tRNA ligase subunit beta [Tissierellia bacterium]|nr:glycine--tRNA ligase subunit beta [Tissierellia bacterium]